MELTGSAHSKINFNFFSDDIIWVPMTIHFGYWDTIDDWLLHSVRNPKSCAEIAVRTGVHGAVVNVHLPKHVTTGHHHSIMVSCF